MHLTLGTGSNVYKPSDFVLNEIVKFPLVPFFASSDSADSEGLRYRSNKTLAIFSPISSLLLPQDCFSSPFRELLILSSF
jgi:hypothetical protein